MFFNSRNGQRHFLRYFQHRFFVDSAKNENAATLGRQRLDDGLDLAQRFTGVQLRFDTIFAAQQFQVGHRFETDHFVAAGGIDHQIAGNGKQVGATRGHILPAFRRISAGEDFGDHVVQFVGGRQNTAQAAAQGSFLRQYHCLEPFQFSANPMHVDPLILSAAPLQHSFMFLIDDAIQSWITPPVQHRFGQIWAIDQKVPDCRKFVVVI